MRRSLLACIVAFALLSSACQTPDKDDAHELMHGPEGGHEHEDGNTITFGPGPGPHGMQISLAQFDWTDEISLRADDLPASIARDEARAVRIDLLAKEVVAPLTGDSTYWYWTFNKTVPGPMLRIREGDTIELTLRNDGSSSHNHSIDLHAVNGPGGGASLTQVAPGEQKTFQFKALNPGLYVYHCATPNVPTHVANGMYGMILVEPKEGLLSVDREFYVMQGELYTIDAIGSDGQQWFSPDKMLDRRPEYIVFNGRPRALVDAPLQAMAGERIRIFVGNAGVALSSSFHVIGEIFDRVYPEGGTSPVQENVQTTLIPAGGAAIVEFDVNVPGDYALVDHALSNIDRGAWGILRVEGKEDASIYGAVDEALLPVQVMVNVSE